MCNLKTRICLTIFFKALVKLRNKLFFSQVVNSNKIKLILDTRRVTCILQNTIANKIRKGNTYLIFCFVFFLFSIYLFYTTNIFFSNVIKSKFMLVKQINGDDGFGRWCSGSFEPLGHFCDIQFIIVCEKLSCFINFIC